MRIRCLTTITILILHLLSFQVTAGEAGPKSEAFAAKNQKIDELLFLGEYQQALQLLEESSDGHADSAERLWRLARVYYEIGRLEGEKAFKSYKKSEEYARAAIAADAGNSDGYKWLAIALGAQAKYSDTKTQVHQSREIKDSIERAIVLNPEDDISYLVLSRWHYKVSRLGTLARTFAKIIYGGLPKASLAKAEELLLHAITLHDRVSHRYNLAKVYDRMERTEDAQRQLQTALQLPVTFPEEAEEQEKARKKLENGNPSR